MLSHRNLLWTVATAYLLAAGLTWIADVPVATPIVLALAAAGAFWLGSTAARRSGSDTHPHLGHAEPAPRPAPRVRRDPGIVGPVQRVRGSSP